MAIWDFVKDAGKSIFGTEAHAAEAPTAPAPGQKVAGAPGDSDTERKVAALKKELADLGLTSKDVHLTLRGGDTVVIKGEARDQETLEKLIIALGNIKGIAHVELAEEPAQTAQPATSAGGTPTGTAGTPTSSGMKAPVFHTVKKGETLSAIAAEYLGKAGRYNEIFEANKPMLSDPDKIYPGQTLRIPQA